MLESAGLFEIVVDNHTTTAKSGGFSESLGTNDGGEEGRKDIIPVEIMVMDVEVFLEFADKEGAGGIRLQLFKCRGGASKSLLHTTLAIDGFFYTKFVGHLAEHDGPKEGVGGKVLRGFGVKEAFTCRGDDFIILCLDICIRGRNI